MTFVLLKLRFFGISSQYLIIGKKLLLNDIWHVINRCICKVEQLIRLNRKTKVLVSKRDNSHVRLSPMTRQSSESGRSIH